MRMALYNKSLVIDFTKYEIDDILYIIKSGKYHSNRSFVVIIDRKHIIKLQK